MGHGSCKIVTALVLLLCFCMDFGASIDRITSSQFIRDPEAIVSPGNTFKLGFFSPVNSTNRYVAIWYNKISVITPIWIANRNTPLNDSSGIVTVSENGNLVVLNGEREVLWSSNVSSTVDNSSAYLTDDGNLVLQDDSNGNSSIWESFQHPGDTFVRGMRLISNEKTQDNILITSWKSPSDPSIGSFSGAIDALEIPQLFSWNGSRPYWRSGPWNGRIFIGIRVMYSVYLDGFTLVGDRNTGIFSFSFTYENESVGYNFVLSSEGKLTQKSWDNNRQIWNTVWEIPENECDVYGMCGEFGVCNANNSPVCSCLKGFEPKNVEEWSRGNWTGGCVRRRLLQCERMKNGDEAGKKDGFLKLKTVKVPDFAQWSYSLEQECKDQCLNNCSCVAYSYYADFGCMSWTRNLIDIQKFPSGGADLYIRLAYSEIDNKRNMKVIITIIVLVGAIVLLIVAIFIWMWIPKYRERKRKNIVKLSLERKENHPTFSDLNINQVKLQELPVFNLQKLATATGNFDITNKLGQGGFGPVYWGKLPGGQEIAVKRLSKGASGQGLEEFMNEVVVISKLQHRNLVRLLGCCAEGEEKMLVYEYMPNKSLDAFLFDVQKKQVLDWRKRFHIVEEICRGLLYLHRDSRLRIIHRDLKASNILLDEKLNPKISDFGMARIFGGNEDQANTRRIVGTYGYISPEYAMEGRFSEKSDVFSFGVLLLEIVSGRKNTSFYENEQALTLLGFAWKLWNEGNAATIVDEVVSDPSFQVEILRCIHVGLLCVQELAKDRPTISTVISMLNSEIMDLPIPKQPAFTERQIRLNSNSSEQRQKECSVNIVTLTVLDAR